MSLINNLSELPRLSPTTILGKGKEEQQHLLELFKNHYAFTSDFAFQSTWNHIAKEHHFKWSKKGVSAESLQKLTTAFDAVYHGPGIQPTSPPATSLAPQMANYLIGQGEMQKEFLSKEAIAPFLLKKDPTHLQEMREVLKSSLQHCCDNPPQDEEETVYQAYVGNIIALLPYFYPPVGESFNIPQKVDGAWKACTYKLDKVFELTPRWLGSPITALGLTTVDGGPSLISFLGTSYPTGSGFLLTLFADATPGMSVGGKPFLFGKTQLEKWLDSNPQTEIFGHSLGGALALHLSNTKHPSLKHAWTFNPAGLYPWDYPERSNMPINIYYQDNDLVPTMGAFPKGENVNITRIIPQERQAPIPSHARVFTGMDQVTMYKSSPQTEHKRFARIVLTSLHMLLGAISLPFFLLFILYRLLRTGAEHALGLATPKEPLLPR